VVQPPLSARCGQQLHYSRFCLGNGLHFSFKSYIFLCSHDVFILKFC
jgi:hypothetical protein